MSCLRRHFSPRVSIFGGSTSIWRYRLK